MQRPLQQRYVPSREESDHVHSPWCKQYRMCEELSLDHYNLRFGCEYPRRNLRGNKRQQLIIKNIKSTFRLPLDLQDIVTSL